MTTVKDEDVEPRGVRCSLFRAGRGSHSFPSVFRSPANVFSFFSSRIQNSMLDTLTRREERVSILNFLKNERKKLFTSLKFEPVMRNITRVFG